MNQDQEPKKEPILNHDFDNFAGTWTEEEADEFDRRIAEISKVDWEMWDRVGDDT